MVHIYGTLGHMNYKKMFKKLIPPWSVINGSKKGHNPKIVCNRNSGLISYSIFVMERITFRLKVTRKLVKAVELC